MKHTALLIALLAWASCSSPVEKTGTAESVDTTQQEATFPPIANAKLFDLLDLPNLEDNVRNDTLLIYTTHALGNGTFVMAAKNVEETREGLRLVLYRPLKDSSAQILAVSKPAYDSEVMLPTYFTTGDTADGIIILANYGGLESWGQNIFWLKDRHFKDLGWLDVSQRGWKTRMDSLQQWRINIAPMTEVSGAEGRFDFTFRTDSVRLFDDQLGHQEVMLSTDRIRYRYDGQKMVLVVDGKARAPAPL